MTDWALLNAELDRWHAAGRVATLWWRDDDATRVTPALERLLRIRNDLGVGLTLAVIPAGAEPALAAAVAAEDKVAPVQHGYAHANHAPPGADKAELGDHRPVAAVAAELAAGRDRLATLFGTAPLPVLVPPWNRIAAGVVAALPALGFRGLSTIGARHAGEAPALVRANTHIDIIDWPGTRGFIGEAAALGAALDHLAARRAGRADAGEPTGLLTHHLAHDGESWEFVRRLVARTAAHPAARWLTAADVFADPS